MAKLSTPTPDDITTAQWRGIFKIEATTLLGGGTPTFNGADEPTAAPSNAQGAQIAHNLEMLRHRNAGPVRNAVLSGSTDAAGVPDYLNVTAIDEVTVLGASEPLVVSFANGFGRIGSVDHVAVIDTDIPVDATSILAGANGYYPVFAIYDTSDGSVSFAFGNQFPLTAVSPWEIAKAAPSLATGNVPGRYWYDPQKGQAWRTEGTPGSVAWVRVCAVWIGWLDLDTNQVTSDVEAPFTGTDANYVPAGMVVAFGSSTPPAGWLTCNGAAISRSTYGRLFGVIGTAFGAGDGSTTFNLPDLRGEFIRGFDAGRGVDTGRVFGSAQSEMIGPHTHDLNAHSGNGSNGGTYAATHNTGADHLTTDANTGTENRPRNVALSYIISF